VLCLRQTLRSGASVATLRACTCERQRGRNCTYVQHTYMPHCSPRAPSNCMCTNALDPVLRTTTRILQLRMRQYGGVGCRRRSAANKNSPEDNTGGRTNISASRYKQSTTRFAPYSVWRCGARRELSRIGVGHACVKVVGQRVVRDEESDLNRGGGVG